MSQANSLFNFLAVTAIICAAVYFTVSPRAPQPLPNDPQWVSRINRPGVVLVKFGAEWCPPCRQIEGELDRLAATSGGRVTVVKVNVDDQRALAQHYRVSGIPHLILFQDGQQRAEAKGYRSHEQLQSWIAANTR